MGVLSPLPEDKEGVCSSEKLSQSASREGNMTIGSVTLPSPPAANRKPIGRLQLGLFPWTILEDLSLEKVDGS